MTFTLKQKANSQLRQIQCYVDQSAQISPVTHFMLISTLTSLGDSKWLEQRDSYKSTTVTKKR